MQSVYRSSTKQLGIFPGSGVFSVDVAARVCGGSPAPGGLRPIHPPPAEGLIPPPKRRTTRSLTLGLERPVRGFCVPSQSLPLAPSRLFSHCVSFPPRRLRSAICTHNASAVISLPANRRIMSCVRRGDLIFPRKLFRRSLLLRLLAVEK